MVSLSWGTPLENFGSSRAVILTSETCRALFPELRIRRSCCILRLFYPAEDSEMGKAKAATKPAKRTKLSVPFTKLCKCGHYNHNRRSACELCGNPLRAKKKQAAPKRKQATPYADFQNKSVAAFDYLTTFNGDFDQAVEFLSALKPLVDTGPPNKAS